MSAPFFGDATEKSYTRLPDVYREADEEQSYDHPLKRFVSAGAYSLDDASVFIDRIDPFDDGKSDLVDPTRADIEWLGWMAQLVGVKIPSAYNNDEARDAVQYASAGFRAGTRRAIIDAARSALTGTKLATLYDHRTALGVGTVWDVLLITRVSETPDILAVEKAVAERNAKPAGVILHFRSYESSWNTIETTYSTWDTWDTTTWTMIEEAGL